jgi:hypothetical protein
MDFQSLQKLRFFLSIIFPAVGRHLITPELAKVLALDVNARLVVLCAVEQSALLARCDARFPSRLGLLNLAGRKSTGLFCFLPAIS